MESLIDQFHNLGGSTVSEHKKNFSAYRRDLAKSEIDIDEYFSKLQPNNRQEEIFKIKLLQDHKRHNNLYDILKTGDKINSAVILKNAEFLSIFEGVSGADFVQKICPELSFVNRVRIVNKLGLTMRSYEIAKDYFENLRSKYGLVVATPLLNACSEEYIQEVVIKYDLRLNQGLLIRLYKKYRSFLHFYYARNADFEGHEKVGRYVANTDIKTYHSLIRYGCPKLGKSGLKKFLKTYKLEVLKYPNLMVNKRKVLLQNLSRDEFLVYLRSNLPASVDNFEITVETLRDFRALPKSERGAALFTCFKKLHGFELTDEVELLSDNVLEILSNQDRLRFDLESRPEMLPTSISVPKLQALFFATKNHAKKSEYGRKLIKSCAVNDDNEALLQVLNFFCENYNPLPMDCFEALGKLPLEKLSAQHWVYINELKLCYKINHGEANMIYDLMDKVLLYKMLNGIDYVEDLKTLCKKNSHYYKISFDAKYVMQERECLIRCCEILEEIFKDEAIKAARNNLIHQIIYFNKKHPKLIVPYQAYADVLRALVADLGGNQYCHYLYSVENFLRTKPADILRDEEVLDGFMRNAHDVYWDTLYMWFLKHRPDLVEKYSDSLFTTDRLSKRVYYEISKMHYTSLYRVVVDKALNHIKGEEACGFVSAIKLLSHIQSIDLQPFIQKYLPAPECKIDAFTPNMSDILKIQKSIIFTIKNASPPSNNFTNTLYFCRGDYLKFALDPLYYCIYHSPENMIEGILEELLTRAVSVRKHTLHLVTCVSTTANKFRILKKFAETETNASLKCFTIRKLLRCFMDERNEESFGLLKEHVGMLSINDWFTTRIAFRLKKIPNIFYNDYVEMLWNVVENPGCMIMETMLLNDNLSRRIIKETLYGNKYCSDALFGFIKTYLLSDKETEFQYIKPPTPERLEQRLEYMKTSRRFMEYICKEFLKNSEQNTKRKVIVLEKLNTIFKGLEFKLLIEITKLFLINTISEVSPSINEDFIRSLKDGDAAIDLANILKDDNDNEAMEVDSNEEPKDTNVEGDETLKYPLEERNKKVHPSNGDFIKILANFVLYQLKTSLEMYGADVIPILGDLVRGYLEDFYKTIYEDEFELLLRLVEVILKGDYHHCGDITDVVIMAIFFLPKNSTKISGYKKRRADVLEEMRKLGSDVVQIYVIWFLENCEK